MEKLQSRHGMPCRAGRLLAWDNKLSLRKTQLLREAAGRFRTGIFDPARALAWRLGAFRFLAKHCCSILGLY